MVFAVTAGVVTVAPSVLTGAAVGNAIILTSGDRIANWIWKQLYLSRSLRVMFSENDKEKFMYLLIGLAIRAKPSNHSRRIGLDANILCLLKNEACPFRDIFYDSLGRVIKDYVYLPMENFYIPSLKTKNSDSWTWIMVCPLTNGPSICGFDFWTYSWFWGLPYKDLTPHLSNIMLQSTVEYYMNCPKSKES